jgi:hypothetical protein
VRLQAPKLMRILKAQTSINSNSNNASTSILTILITASTHRGLRGWDCSVSHSRDNGGAWDNINPYESLVAFLDGVEKTGDNKHQWKRVHCPVLSLGHLGKAGRLQTAFNGAQCRD